MMNLRLALDLPARRPARDRGSILVFVVVIVVLVALMGATYVQMARVDRRATRSMDTQVDPVHDSIIELIRQRLKEDVVNREGDLFKTDESEDYVDASNQPIEIVEPYDYPYTNPDGEWRVYRERDQQPFPGGPAEGGDQDDPWLASTAPDVDDSNAANDIVWPHITNLRGVYLKIPSNDPWAEERASNASHGSFAADGENAYFSDTDAHEADLIAYGADADGDGINDSRWQWAPMNQMLGSHYVMAVRIIDNSSLVDVNTWTNLTAAGGGLDNSGNGEDAPRWLWPAELDMRFFLEDWLGDPGNAAYGILTGVRNLPGGNPASITPFRAPNARSRYWNWLDSGRMYRNPAGATDLADWRNYFGDTVNAPTAQYDRYDLQNELEMRWRNGLNRSTDQTELEDDMGAAFSRLGATETQYSDWAGGAGYAQKRDFLLSEPRHQLTTLSGSTPLRQVDLNNQSAGSIRSAVRSELGQDGSGFDQAVDDNLAAGVVDFATRWVDLDSFATQLAASVQDWTDRDTDQANDIDTELTRVEDRNNPGNYRYGMEYLPFISEVYLRPHYEVTDRIERAGEPGVYDVTWTLQRIGIAIEVTNPFAFEIPLAGLNMYVGDTSLGSLEDLLDRTELGANDQVAIYTASSGPDDAFDGTDEVENVGTADTIDWEQWPTGSSDDVELQLRVPASEGDPVSYHRFLTREIQETLSAAYDTNNGDVLPPANSDWYRDLHTVATANGLSTMTVPLAELSVDTNAQSDPASGAGAGLRLPGETWTAFHFDEATKNPAFDTRFVGQEPFLIANSGRIVRSGEVLRMMLVGPTENEGFPDVFARARRTPGGSITVADWQMPLVAERAGGDNADNVPYHVRVLSRLTTLASREDGQDNDNLQGADSPREGLIAGLINVNTAPQHLLERVIPHPGSADIALRIATLRDDPALLGRGGSYKGLAHISEIDTNPGTGAGAKAIDDLFGLGDDSGDLVDLSGIVMDFNENELPGTSAYRTPGTPDGRTDDREEATLMTKYLAQVLGTRSDIFTAYILVRKYPANDFRSGAELEEYRLVAVFDRSSVSETGSRVRVLAIAEVE